MLKDGNPYLELLEASRGAKGGYTPYPSYYPQQMLNYQQMYNPMAMYPYYSNSMTKLRKINVLNLR